MCIIRLRRGINSCLTAIKNHWIKYCEKTYEREGINYFWSIKNSTEILNKLKTKGFQASTISTYDLDVKKFFIWPAMKNVLFSLPKNIKKYDSWSCQKVTDALIYLLDNIYIRFGSKLYRQNVGISMGKNCAPLLLICFCSALRGTS